MTSFWALAVARDELSRTALVEGPVPAIGDGEALLRVDRVGLTANNVTYHEDLLILYRPLFFTSFMLADRLEDNDWFGAEALVLSSASSKTAYGTAFLLRGKAPRLVGLTSARHVAFTESLGCYDRVLPYEAADQLSPDVAAAYLDFAGRADVRSRIRDHLGARLVHDAVVGLTHQEQSGVQALDGPRTTVFFAPDQMRKRSADWGREGLDARFAQAWRGFAAAAEGWVDVVRHRGHDALREVWLDVLAGRSEPRTGHVVTF